MTIADFVAITGDTTRLPVNTAIEELRRFIADRRDGRQLPITALGESSAVPPGTIVLGTPGHPAIARWLQEGKLAIPGAAAGGSASVDAYEIAVVDGCIAVAGANPRAVLYGAFELEDILAADEGLPDGFRSRATPGMGMRLLHPRARGGFHSYVEEDFEFIARAGANVAHLSHDWMGEKNLFSFVPSSEFPDAIDTPNLERNRERMRQYLEWCERYGLDAALWLTEIVCQGGPWVPDETRERFLQRFPAEVLEDTGTYQGKLLCLAHPRVERAYREMVRRLLTDFPQLGTVLVFTRDANGELCDPTRCPRHDGISKHRQYNRLLALLLEEGRSVRPDFQVFLVGWGWHFRGDPEFLPLLASLPDGAGLTSLPDGEAWSFDRKRTDDLVQQRQATRARGQSFLGYDIFFWGDDTQFPVTELYDFPLGVAAKLGRWTDLGADGFFDQWGTQAEYVANNAVALRQMVFHPELTAPGAAAAFVRELAAAQYGEAAAAHVVAAWEEIEAAQQIQSDHTYFWHPLRPNWSGAVLASPLNAEALRAVTLHPEPPKPHGDIDHAPHRDGLTAARVLGQVLPAAADHFGRAVASLEAALEAIDPDHRSQYEHWYRARSEYDDGADAGARARLTPRQSLEKQLVAVRTHERVQRQMGWFFEAFAIAHELPATASPERAAALARLAAISAAAGR